MDVFDTVLAILKGAIALLPEIVSLIRLAVQGGSSDHPLFPQIQALFGTSDGLDDFVKAHAAPVVVTPPADPTKQAT